MSRVPLLVFLQNAWSPHYAGSEWPREFWLPALARSRSGQRLRIVVEDPRCCWNTTPIVGESSKSIVKPDESWIEDVLATRSPGVVLACGGQAEEALGKLWQGPFLAIPHPASRVLTTELLIFARLCLEEGVWGRLALRQRRGRVEVEAL